VKSTPENQNDWERVWLSTRRHNWSSLALIPSDPGVDVTGIAETLVATGRQHGERPVSLLSAKGTQLTDIRQLLDTLEAMTGRGEWVIVPVDPLHENPSSVAVVQATSAAVLVVSLGKSIVTSARSAIEAVGRGQFLGSIVIDGPGQHRRPSLHRMVPVLAFVCSTFLLAS
jgi:hypothetical protein